MTHLLIVYLFKLPECQPKVFSLTKAQSVSLQDLIVVKRAVIWGTFTEKYDRN